jgi:hypothetical protein
MFPVPSNGTFVPPDLEGGTEALVRHSAVTADWLPVSNGELTASCHFVVVDDEGSRGSRVNVSGPITGTRLVTLAHARHAGSNEDGRLCLGKHRVVSSLFRSEK